MTNTPKTAHIEAIEPQPNSNQFLHCGAYLAGKYPYCTWVTDGEDADIDLIPLLGNVGDTTTLDGVDYRITKVEVMRVWDVPEETAEKAGYYGWDCDVSGGYSAVGELYRVLTETQSKPLEDPYVFVYGLEGV